jgi:ribonucleoside-diphosphate reductase alpha chain
MTPVTNTERPQIVEDILQNTNELQFNDKRLKIGRRFTKPNVHPFDEIEFEKRSSVIAEPDGKVVFSLENIDVPKSWTQLATDIIVSKYFRKAGVPGTGHEINAKQVVHRIANTIRLAGESMGYFQTTADADAFEMELMHILITQKGAFNSPVWFNCGLYHQYGIPGTGGNWYWDFETQSVQQTAGAYARPQCSACFIQTARDDLMGIFDLVKSEARLFKYGSGSGTNFSPLRSKYEKLSGGGTSSGLITFLEVFDRAAGSLKSGGTTRRAAKMVCLDMDHPEIVDFINWKVNEEKKVKALIAAGYSSDFNGEAYHTVAGQNSNNSVRIPDEFMNAYLAGGKWKTRTRTNGEVHREYEARDLMRQISYAAWACADPGVQFDTIINDWHTSPNTDRIYASNPCSEYMFLNDTACNLSSVNLMKFLNEDGTFDIDGYRWACKILFVAQEILVDFSSYPTQSIGKNSHDYRPLGLGYANLGTVLMVMGIPYDSERGQAIGAAFTAIMTGHAYRVSAEMAAVKGPFEGYAKNREPMLRVMNKHRDAAYKIDVRHCPADLLRAAREDWDTAVELGEKYGYRNAQATVLAPTGTIGLLMDCDTTGVEPDFALVKFKKLAGGGYFKIINQSVPRALSKLGYTDDEIDDIQAYVLGRGTLEGAPHVNPAALKTLGYTDDQIKEAKAAVEKAKSMDEWTPHIAPKALKEKGLTAQQVNEAVLYISGSQTVEGAPHLKEEHLPVFDCANKCGIGKRFIDPMGHIKMMAAVQPFLSGSLSKTVNLPNETTVDEIEKIYVEGWKLGLKAIAVYRDGCKLSQPLNSVTKQETDEKKAGATGVTKELPAKRTGRIMDAIVGGHKIVLRTGEFADGTLGEVGIDMHKEGATMRALMNCIAQAVSIGLQHGVPLDKFVDTFTFTRFEPAGMTTHPNIKTSTSIVDFVFRVLGLEYLGRTDFVHVKPAAEMPAPKPAASVVVPSKPAVAAPTPAAVASATPAAKAVKARNAAEASLSNMMGDAPACNICGHITVRNAACYKCLNCGNSLGCS